MPKRLIVLSRTEPARTILIVVAALTLLMELATLLPIVTPLVMWLPQFANVMMVGGFALWGVLAGGKNSIKHMSLSSFWLFLIWLWSGLTRLAFSPNPTLLLWCPFLVVAACMAVVYLYLSYQRKVGGLQ